jgi:hypothetical protein
VLRQLVQTLDKTLIDDSFKVLFFSFFCSEEAFKVSHKPFYIFGAYGLGCFDLCGGRSPILSRSILEGTVSRNMSLLVTPETCDASTEVLSFFIS